MLDEAQSGYIHHGILVSPLTQPLAETWAGFRGTSHERMFHPAVPANPRIWEANLVCPCM
jgi:hypothetical protein